MLHEGSRVSPEKSEADLGANALAGERKNHKGAFVAAGNFLGHDGNTDPGGDQGQDGFHFRGLLYDAGSKA